MLRYIKYTFMFLAVIALAICGVIIYFSFKVPDVTSLKNYSPPAVTEVFDINDVKIGEFYKERRLPVPLEEIPQKLAQAFIASEDDNFFHHPGIDLKGIVRAFFKNLLAGGVKQGGSTITQQVAKSLLLSSKRTISRKIKEAILAYRMEHNLTKNQILEIYLNQIYLGHGSYGVKAAAENYFGKELDELNLAEMALLAGLPQAPSRYSPLRHPDRAKRRQLYVLNQMLKNKMITGEEKKEALLQRIFIMEKRDYNKEFAPYFTEHVRKYLMNKYGTKRVLEGGLKVYTTLDLEKQVAAKKALRKGLMAIDKRQGFRGPLKHLSEDEFDKFISKAIQQWGEAVPSKEDLYEALVTEINDKEKVAVVSLGPYKAIIPMELMAWAKKYTENKFSSKPPVVPSDVLKKGDVILMRIADKKDLSEERKKILDKKYKDYLIAALEQEPNVEGAIVSLDPSTGRITAMVGGYDFNKSQFNRAVQARRQPGSAFKPIIFAAAIDKGYTPASMIIDAPIVFDDPLMEEKWKPKNYGGKFRGETIFRDALIKSRNIPTVKIVQDIGINYLINYAKRLGFTSEFQKDYSIALGSCVASPLEMAKIYAVFANGGIKVEPFFIRRITDRNGNVLETNDPNDAVLDSVNSMKFASEKLNEKEKGIENAVSKTADKEIPPEKAEELAEEGHPNRVISRQTAYIMTHLMKEVVTSGTGYRVRALKRPAAGKTGTTNDNADAWFVGYTPELVTAVWVGFDDVSKSLGRGETGSRAASPIWLSFMKEALKDNPVISDFKVPPGIVFAKIDRKTGKLADKDTKDTVFEAFKEGTLPSSDSKDEGTLEEDREKFFIQ